MKNKVLTGIVISGVGMLALTGCAKDNKTEFLKYSQAFSKTTYQKFDMNLSHAGVTADSQYQMYAPIINGYLSDFKLSGDSSIDGKNKAIATNVKLLGQTFSLDFLIKGDTPYMKLDNIGPILNFYLNMTNSGNATQSVDTTSLKNKYVDLIAIGQEKEKKTADVKSIMTDDSGKAVEKILKSLDKSNFTKKGSAITLTLSGKELAKIVQSYIDALPKASQDSIKSAANDKNVETEISKTVKSSTITLDNEKHTAESKINFTGEKTNGIGLSGYITYSMSYANKKVAVKVPQDKDIIKSSDELPTIMSKLIPTGLEQ